MVDRERTNKAKVDHHRRPLRDIATTERACRVLSGWDRNELIAAHSRKNTEWAQMTRILGAILLRNISVATAAVFG